MAVPVVMVAAMARNGVIGKANGMPWHMRTDLKHFKATTMGKPMIMGRKTHESIGRLLPGRETIIVTRDRNYKVEGAHMAGTLQEALEIGQTRAAAMGADAVVIAGGGTLYAEALPFADRMVLTELDLEPQGDTRFPEFGRDQWREVSRTPYPRGEGDDARYDVVVWERRKSIFGSD